MGFSFKKLRKKKPVQQLIKKAAQIFPTGFNHLLLNTGTPVWVNTQKMSDYAHIASTNPVVFSAINISANYFANGRVNLRDLKTNETILRRDVSKEDYRDPEIVKKAFEIFDNPNPLQSRWEFLRMYEFMYKTFGNSFLLGNGPFGVETSIENTTFLWNLYPQYMSAVLGGKMFGAKTKDEIIKEWRFGYESNRESSYEADKILHRKDINIQVNDSQDIIYGMSRIKPLTMPISNIKAEYESQNVVLNNRGVRMVIHPGNQNDMTGVEPFDPEEETELQKKFEQYGLLAGQSQNIISNIPIQVTPIDQDIRKLGIFEGLSIDTMAVSNGFAVPYILIKLNIEGDTFENQKEADKRMYENTTIPSFADFINDLTGFLKLRDFGYEYVEDFSHVPALQKDFKEKATATKTTSDTYKDLFKCGGCTYNTWLKAIDEPQDAEIGELKIFDLPPEHQALILGKPEQINQGQSNTNNGQNQEE